MERTDRCRGGDNGGRMGKPGGGPQLGILEKVCAGERTMLSSWCHSGNSLPMLLLL